MRGFRIALLGLLPALLAAGPLHAETPYGDAPGPDRPFFEQWRHAEELAREGVDKLMRSLDALRNAMPRYGAPYLDPEGNIVIPRQGPPAVPAVPVPEDKPLRT